MTRAVIMAWHKYTPFGDQFYEPILDFQLKTLKKYEDEYDMVYLVDSNWEVKWKPERNSGKVTVIRVSPHLRYYDAYKEVLPQIEEDLVLFMDNDMVVYKKDKIGFTFRLLDKQYGPTPYDVVSIYDTIGNTFEELGGKSKFCPYWFATRKELLMKYLDVEWGPNMPEYETLGKLTEEMIKGKGVSATYTDGIFPKEWEEDKNSIYFDGTKDGEKGKDLGYYHVRAGSTPAYLLATKKYGDMNTYLDYMKNQPTREYLRQACWYKYMGGEWEWPEFEKYYQNFLQYHNLP